jgi:DNA segregation ATPase FtsK/SpoIIIE, S-DNA-T family
MSMVTVNPGARPGDRIAVPQIQLQPPPVTPQPSSGGGMAGGGQLMMIPMMLGMGAMSFSSMASRGGPMLILFGVLFGAVVVGVLVLTTSRGSMARKAQINVERRNYLRHLQQVRGQVHRIADDQRRGLLRLHPDPGTTTALAQRSRLWERGRAAPAFGDVRLATGPQRIACHLQIPETAPLEDLDPLSASALRRLLRSNAVLADLPVALSLRTVPRVVAGGDRGAAEALVRALLAQLVTFHSPQDVRLGLCVAPDRAAKWAWTAWLPHLLHPTGLDAGGPVRQYAADLATLEALLGDQLGTRSRYAADQPASLDQPHVVVLVDGGDTTVTSQLNEEAGLSGVTVISLGDTGRPGPNGLRLVVEPERLGISTRDGVALVGRPDRLGTTAAATLARSLTRLHTTRRRADRPDRAAPLTGDIGLPDLLGLGDLDDVDFEQTQCGRPAHQRLRIPFGVDADGIPIELDLKESAEGGMGPHGLVIGATGSGKSELLRTLVLGLAATHPSKTLNFVLVDFKGGATFAGLGALPHTAAVITNLADDSTLVTRMRDALSGELVRRQEVLRDAGNYASVRDYERARLAGADLPAMPSLMVIIDEFSELLSAEPEFIDLFVMIGRLGRSLGVHLMLASQRLDEGRLRGLDSHLSYRIGLRTFSAGESRAVLGVTDAATLPPVPGSGYLRVDTETLLRFKAAYVSAPAPTSGRAGGGPGAGRPGGTPAGPTRHLRTTADSTRVRPFSLAAQPFPAPPPAGPGTTGPAVTTPAAGSAGRAPGAPDPMAPTVTDVMVRMLQGRGVPAHAVWLPPLDAAPALSRLLPPLATTADRGLCPAGWSGNGRLEVPIAVIDRPYQQRQDLLWVRLAEAAGHLAVVGGPRSGKSTVLRTLVMSLALTHTPREVQVYGLDLGGGTLAALAGLPHVGGVASRLQPDRCSRLVAEVASVLDSREQLFLDEGIDSMETFRRRRADGERLGDRDLGDVFLVIDGWLTLREDFPDLYDQVVTLVARGLTYGVHVVMTAQRWMEIRAQVKDIVGTRIELRLGDPMDSDLGRRSAAEVPEGAPGRGMNVEKLHLLTALPRIDDAVGPDGLTDAVGQAVRAVADAWDGAAAAGVRMLPVEVTEAELTDALSAAGTQVSALRLPIGVAERDLGPLCLDLATEPHLTVFGDVGSGKTGLLRSLSARLTALASPEQARLVVIDYRRTLLGEVSAPHLAGYAGSAKAAADVVARCRVGLSDRIPGPDITPAQLRARSWWTGPELFILVDDYDLVSTGRENPLTPLLEFIPQARDLGLHLILTRRSAGAGRASYDAVLQQLADSGGAGLLLSGSKDEGPVFGGLKMTTRGPGRGTLVRRSDRPGLVQVAWTPPAA